VIGFVIKSDDDDDGVKKWVWIALTTALEYYASANFDALGSNWLKRSLPYVD
jgi:hypothetical protein